MNNYNELLINLPKIHTTELGYERIKNNLNIGDSDVVNYCRNLINDSNSANWKKLVLQIKQYLHYRKCILIH